MRLRIVLALAVLTACECDTPARDLQFACVTDDECTSDHRCVRGVCRPVDGGTAGGTSGGAAGGAAGGAEAGGGEAGGAAGGSTAGGSTAGGGTAGGFGPASRLAFTSMPSSTAVRGVALAAQPAVTVQDASGTTVTTATNVVTLAAYSDAACMTSLGAMAVVPASSKAAAAGVAVFDAVSVYAAGTVYLGAAATGLTSACSGAIAVSGTLFTDSAAALGVTETTAGAYGWTAFSDLDGDGRPDLALCTVSGHTTHFNTPSGAWRAGPWLDGGTRAVVLGDCDNDGFRDVFTTNGPLSSYFFRNAGDGGFVDERVRSNITSSNPEGSAVLDYDKDGLLDYVHPEGSANGGHMNLWRNTGDCIFTQATAASGLPAANLGNGEQVIALDYDADRDVDLFYTVAQGITDGGGVLKLFENGGAGTFTDVSNASGLGQAAALDYRAGLAAGDFDNDGDFDLFIGRDQGKTRSLLRNDGSTFTNVIAQSGDLATATADVEGCAFADLDNDGLLDLYVASDQAADEVFRNLGGGRFARVAQAGPADVGGDRDSTGVAVADIDLDGDLDVYVNNRGATASHLYVNRHGGASFLKVRVRGRGGAGKHPADGSGAVVQLFDSTGTVLRATREVSGGAALGQSDALVHFGLAASWGGATGSYVVKVHFNSGVYTVPMTVQPSQASTVIGGTTLANTLDVLEP